jgi:hypothetical protein
MASSIVTLDYSRSLYFPLPHGIPLLHSTKRAEPLHRHALFAATFESAGALRHRPADACMLCAIRHCVPKHLPKNLLL